MSVSSDSFRYLPTSDRSAGWGIDLVDIGRQRIDPGTDYPPDGHPTAYRFSWTKGRILDEYQILFLTRGRGEFDNGHEPTRTIGEGDLVLLRPGQWHRYRPLAEVGWTEQWIGFRGRLAPRMIDHFLPVGESVLNIGLDQQVLACFETALAWMRTPKAGHRQVAATKVLEILAIARARALARNEGGNSLEDKLHRGQLILLNRMSEPLEMPAIARELGLSYSKFRQRFKQATGYAPGAYLRQIRINRARDLLRSTERTIGDIAESTGFGSVYYFSKAFRQETGRPPGAFRRENSR